MQVQISRNILQCFYSVYQCQYNEGEKCQKIVIMIPELRIEKNEICQASEKKNQCNQGKSYIRFFVKNDRKQECYVKQAKCINSKIALVPVIGNMVPSYVNIVFC